MLKALIFDAIEQKKPDHATYQSAVVADALQVRSNAKLDLLRHLLSRPLPDPRSNVVARLLAVFVHQRRCHCHAPIVQPLAQFGKLPFAIPWAQQLLPRDRLIDARRLFELHARAIQALAANADGLAQKDKAFTMTAELYLMQHSCHWFCRSRPVASARLLARHHTSYEQVLAAVTPSTRRAYEALVR